MTRTSSTSSSCGLAALAAGPLFLLGLVVGTYVASAEPVFVGDLAQLPTSALQILPLLLVASAVGACLGALPILAGNWLMTELARDNIGLRFPPVWAIVGGAMAGTPAFLLSEGSPSDGVLGVALTCAGAGSALICCAGARWND